MHRCRCDVQGIRVGCLWQKPLLNDRDCQLLSRIRDLQERNSFKNGEPPCGPIWMT